MRRIAALRLAAALLLLGCAGDDEPQATATTTATTDDAGDDSWDTAATECVYYGTGGSPLYDVAVRELWEPVQDPPPEPQPLWRLDNAACESDWLHAIDITAQGVLCAAGHRARPDSSCADSCPISTPWVRCLSPSYEELWSRSYDAGTRTIAALVTTPDGGVVLTGARHNATPPAEGYAGAPWIAALDPAGDLLWEHAQPTPGALRAVDRGGDGTLVVVGDVVVDDGRTDLFAAAYAPDGSVLWTTTYDSATYEAALDVAVDDLGRAWVVGMRRDDVLAPHLGVDAFDSSWGHGLFRVDPYRIWGTTAVVALLSPDGAVQWVDVPPEDPSTWTAAVVVLPGGDAVVGGELAGDDSLARYTPEGTIAWIAGGASASVTALALDGAGDVLAIGSDCACVMKLDADGHELATQRRVRSDALALTPAGAPLVGHYIESGWFYPPVNY
ncbi:MAG: hypothetical protein R3A79_08135 [Nannocystaceae bacterium]